MKTRTSTARTMIDKISQRFCDNPRLKLFIGDNHSNPFNRVRHIVRYAYEIAQKSDGLYTSNNSHAHLLYYIKKNFRLGTKDIINYLRMILFSIGFRNLWNSFRVQQSIKKGRARLDNYLYVWFLSQDAECRSLSGLVEIKNHLVEIASRNALPILCETTCEQNLKLFRKAGFHMYNHTYDDRTKLNTWYLRMDVS